MFAIQSNSLESRSLLVRIEEFIDNFLEDLGKMEFPEKDFNSIKTSKLTNMKMPPINSYTMFDLLIDIIQNHQSNFEWVQKQISNLTTLSYDQFIRTIVEILSEKNKRRIAVLKQGVTFQKARFDYQLMKPKQFFSQ